MNNRVAVLRYLLHAKANPNSLHPEFGYTVMHDAARNVVDVEIIRALAHAGAHINKQDKDNWTPLHWIGWSSAGGSDEDRLMRAEVLVDCGAAPSLKLQTTGVWCCIVPPVCCHA